MTTESGKAVSLSIILSITAGFADTVTFTAADNLFSAHVTGNFVVFVYNLITEQSLDSWLKLMSFPIFIAAVAATFRIFFKASTGRTAFFVEGCLLLVSGLLAWWLAKGKDSHAITVLLISMVIVFAMGIQNAAGKMFSKETVAPTTVMTGNVTQVVMDITRYMVNKSEQQSLVPSITKQLLVIGSFLVGCIAGGCMGFFYGLEVMIIPGILLILFFLPKNNTTLKQ